MRGRDNNAGEGGGNDPEPVVANVANNAAQGWLSVAFVLKWINWYTGPKICLCVHCFEKCVANPLLSISYHAEDNWNPIEWDRAAEELTWERVSVVFPNICIKTEFHTYNSWIVVEDYLHLVSASWTGWLFGIFGKENEHF